MDIELRLEERKPKNGHISTDLIFYDTGERVLGFDRLTHSFIEWDYAIAEEVVKIVVDGSIAGIILNNSVIGYTAGSGALVVHSLGLSEKPLSVNIKTDIISLMGCLKVFTRCLPISTGTETENSMPVFSNPFNLQNTFSWSATRFMSGRNGK